MPQIALITVDPDFIEQARVTSRNLGMHDALDVYLTTLTEAVELASRLRHKNVDAIIARYGLAMMIQEADIRIPVVEIGITGQDLARACLEACEASGLQHPRAAFIAFDNMVTDIAIIARITGVEITTHRLRSNEDIAPVVHAVAAMGYDVIFGGSETTALARSIGHRAILIQSGDLSLKHALLEAKKVVQGRQLEKQNTQKFRALVDFSPEGIVSIDQQKHLQIINPTAARLLQCDPAAFLGKPLETLLDLPGIDRCLRDGHEIMGEVIQRDNTWISFNVGPIIVEGATIGAFLTFQEISRVQEAEATIRNKILAKKFAAKYTFADIIGRSPQVAEAKRIAGEIARTDATILIQGESGTGKELFAQGIHQQSPRRHEPFVAINCGALPPNLLESELFGYVEGAFTGATRKGKPGLFEMAHRGTLFLDEISEMDKYGQSRLLRALQEKQIMRLGGDKYIPVDVRIIAASNRNLPQLIASGQFRQDLYYRLKVLVLNLPPLHLRSGDVEYLASEFLSNYSRQYKKPVELTPDAYRALACHAWPGNVRELVHFIERLVITAGGSTVDSDQITRVIENREYEQAGMPLTARESPPNSAPARGESTLILSALDANGYNIKQTALALGISRPTLYRKLRQHSIHIRKSL